MSSVPPAFNHKCFITDEVLTLRTHWRMKLNDILCSCENWFLLTTWEHVSEVYLFSISVIVSQSQLEADCLQEQFVTTTWCYSLQVLLSSQFLHITATSSSTPRSIQTVQQSSYEAAISWWCNPVTSPVPESSSLLQWKSLLLMLKQISSNLYWGAKMQRERTVLVKWRESMLCCKMKTCRALVRLIPSDLCMKAGEKWSG